MVDVAGFRARYPEFGDPPTDATIQTALDDAECDFSRSKLSNNACGNNIYDRIIYALAAHEVQVGINRTRKQTVGSGQIVSKTVGKVSVSYNRKAPGSNLDDYYGQTIYGDQYLALLQKYCPAIIAVC